jgi:hypothetical protein
MNAYMFSGPGHYSTPAGQAKRKVVLRMCAASACLMMLRLPGPHNPLTFLGDRFGALLPELPTSDSAGQRCGEGEAMCGPRLCTYKAAEGGSGHLGWELPLLPSSYFLPGSNLHFVVFFLPGILLARHLVDYLVFPVLMLSGPLLSMWLSAAPAAGAGGERAASYSAEWPSVWCMMSVAQVALALVREAVLTSGKSGKAARRAAAAAALGGISAGGGGLEGKGAAAGAAPGARVVSLQVTTAAAGGGGQSLRRRA